MALSFKKWDAYRVYLILSGATSFFFALIFTINMVYQVQTVGLNPLQLVLVGTLLETVCLLFEVPTGVVADVYSRRLSVIIGLVLIGIGFMIEGMIPLFEGVLLAQIFWGVGATFMSGATDAWITDEIGEERAGQAFLRGSQVGSFAWLIGTGVSVALASIHLQLPIVIGSGCFVLLGLLFTVIMPENGFKPAPRKKDDSWHTLFKTFGEGVKLVRVRPVLLTILLISAVYGMFSEGLDRLSTAHFLTTIGLPAIGNLNPVVWFGLISAGGSVIVLFSNEIVRRRVNTSDSLAVSRALTLLYGLLIVSVVWFALSASFAGALIAGWFIGVMRSAIGPLEGAWTNLHVDSSVRATVLSMRSQSNAFGQIAGGPGVGYVATTMSLRVALTISALLLTPALWLFARSKRPIVAAEAAAAD